MVFVDYWNLQATLQQEDGREQGLLAARLRAHRFNLDGFGVGPKLVQLAATKVSPETPRPAQIFVKSQRGR